jgi:hypothetical protein
MGMIQIISNSSDRPACQYCGVPADMGDKRTGILLCARHCQKIMQVITELFMGWRWASQVRFDEPDEVDPA